MRIGQDSEAVVEKCFRRHPEQIRFSRAKRNDIRDGQGRDFYNIALVHHEFVIDLQIKTSSGGETAGIVLPPPRHISNLLREQFSMGMLWKIIGHISRHPNVPCILFVGVVSHSNPEEKVIKDIWRETQRIFMIMRRRQRKR